MPLQDLVKGIYVNSLARHEKKHLISWKSNDSAAFPFDYINDNLSGASQQYGNNFHNNPKKRKSCMALTQVEKAAASARERAQKS